MVFYSQLYNCSTQSVQLYSTGLKWNRCFRPNSTASHVCNLLLCLPALRQADLAVRRFWADVHREGKVVMNKLFVEMLEAYLRLQSLSRTLTQDGKYSSSLESITLLVFNNKLCMLAYLFTALKCNVFTVVYTKYYRTFCSLLCSRQSKWFYCLFIV